MLQRRSEDSILLLWGCKGQGPQAAEGGRCFVRTLGCIWPSFCILLRLEWGEPLGLLLPPVLMLVHRIQMCFSPATQHGLPSWPPCRHSQGGKGAGNLQLPRTGRDCHFSCPCCIFPSPACPSCAAPAPPADTKPQQGLAHKLPAGAGMKSSLRSIGLPCCLQAMCSRRGAGMESLPKILSHPNAQGPH